MYHITPSSSSPVVLLQSGLYLYVAFLVPITHFRLGLSFVELLLLNKMADEVFIKDYVNNRSSSYRSSHLIRKA